MAEIKLRVSLVAAIAQGQVRVADRDDFSGELACLQLRKTLELIAFASLTANKAKYAAAHSNFATHWRAKAMLESLEKIHADFYPKPVKLGIAQKPGEKHFEPVTDGYLTRDDFIFLYDRTSEILHARNPFRSGSRVVDLRLSFEDWARRIRALLAVHLMRPVDTKSIWMVILHDAKDGHVHVYPADPV